MKALTIYQPWASLIAIGAKPYEFRAWEAPRWIRGQRIGIHASARKVNLKEVTDLLRRLQLPAEAWSTGLKPDIAIPFLEKVRVRPDALTLSHMICTAVIGTPVRSYEIAGEFGGAINDSDRDEHANWAWPLAQVEDLIPPRPMKGLQGFWNWGGP